MPESRLAPELCAFRFKNSLVDFCAGDQTAVVFRWVLVKLDPLHVKRLKVVFLDFLFPVSPLCFREVFSCFFCILLRLDAGPRLVGFS